MADESARAPVAGDASYDVVIVGGGPAGLSAALVLVRCRRSVLVIDAGHPRNGRATALHGYLTRDGIAPHEFLHVAREELRSYGLEPLAATVTSATRAPGGFEITVDAAGHVHAQALLIATGVRDRLPDIPGLDACYGITAHHCPYCDGWEARDKVIAVIGEGTRSPAGLALSLRTWSNRIVACTNGCARIGRAHRHQLRHHGIDIADSPIAHVDHDNGRVRRLVFERGGTLACDVIFFTGGQAQQCDLATALGCEFTRQGTVRTDHLGRTCVPDVYVVGDASRDVQFAIVAAAEGAKAGVAINTMLQARAMVTT